MVDRLGLTRLGESLMDDAKTLGRFRKSRIMVPVTAGAEGNDEPLVDWAGMSRLGRYLRAKAGRALDAMLGEATA